MHPPPNRFPATPAGTPVNKELPFLRGSLIPGDIDMYPNDDKDNTPQGGKGYTVAKSGGLSDWCDGE